MKLWKNSPLVLALVLTACGTTTYETAREEVDKAKAEAQVQIQNVGGPVDPNAGSPISYHDDEIWLGDTVIENVHGNPFHERFEKFSISVTTPLTFEEAIDRISSRTGIPFVVEDKDVSFGEEEDNNAGVLTADGRPFLSAPDNVSFGVPGDAPTADAEPRFSLSYSGPLDELVSRLAAQNGYDWVNEGGKVRIFKYLTRTYSIAALPGTQETESALKSDASPGGDDSSGGGAGGTQAASTNFKANTENSTEFKASVKFWSELENELTTIVGEQGKFAISSSRGRVTVTASRQILSRVENFLVGMNSDLVRQVVFHVRIMNVTIDNSDRFGLNVVGNLFNEDKNSGFVFSQTRDIGQGLAGMNGSFGIIDPTSRFSGSSLVWSSLSDRGDVAVINSSSITTLNHVPAPVQVVTSSAYLQSVEQTVTSGDLSSTSLNPGNVTTGFTLKLLPNIFSNGQIMVQYSLTLSDLLALEVFGTGDGQNQIQLPQISSTAFIQHSLVRSGQTIVLAGFERLAHAVNSQTPLPGQMPLLGGSYDGSEKRQMIVITIEPEILLGSTFSTRS